MEQVSQETPDWRAVAEPGPAPEWGPVKRILFRFLFAYLVLYNFPFPLEIIPKYGEILTQPYTDLWNAVVPWIAKHVFEVEIRFFPFGSGDTTYNYIQILCFLVLAALAALIWTVLDRRRPNYVRLHEWLRVYVRFTLAAAMISYGAYKVIPSQFGTPWPSALLQPIGEGSPMRLLWTFMGASASYIIYTGAAEMLGGLLLAFRRTTLLGALVSIGVMSNVVTLNFSYDVPVKLYSSHLLLMAVFLAWPGARRLIDLFVLNRRIEPAAVQPLFRSPRRNRAALVFRTAFLLFLCGTSLYNSYESVVEYRGYSVTPRMYGIWEAEEIAVDGTLRPLLITDESLWRRVIFEWAGAFNVQRMGETQGTYYALAPDPGPHMFVLADFRGQPSGQGSISFKLLQPDLLELTGTVEGKEIRGRFRRVSDSRFPLISRGFHWINEYPLNR